MYIYISANQEYYLSLPDFGKQLGGISQLLIKIQKRSSQIIHIVLEDSK